MRLWIRTNKTDNDMIEIYEKGSNGAKMLYTVVHEDCFYDLGEGKGSAQKMLRETGSEFEIDISLIN